MAQIEPPNRLLEDLRLIISERNQALAEFRSISEKAREDEEKAVRKKGDSNILSQNAKIDF